MLSVVEIGSVVLENKIYSLFRNYLQLEKVGALHFQVWMKLAQGFWRKRLKCEKFTDRWIERGDQKSSLEPSAQVSLN